MTSKGRHFYAGIDIGGTKVNIGCLDENKRIVFRAVFPVREKRCEDLLAEIKEKFFALLEQNQIAADEVLSCVLGVPGTVSCDRRICLCAPNLGWNDEPVADRFEALSTIPTKLIQDSRAAAYGEAVCGAGKGCRTVVCVTLGTGIGTGIVIDGNIYDGALGGAGELGHIPVVEDGRKCGCGKQGCLECYAAGKGLTATAKELFGPEATAGTLFDMAAKDEQADRAIREAIEMLGNAFTSLVNILSPDCFVFSGGLSERKAAFSDPILQYIRNHAYSVSAGGSLKLGYAELGENAPMVGAALSFDADNGKAGSMVSGTRGAKPEEDHGGSSCGPRREDRRMAYYSASVMCADLLHLEDDLKELERCGVPYLHFDIMDGHFVPNLMLPLDMMRIVRKASGIKQDIHLMTEHPEQIIPKLSLMPGDIVSVHYESTPHVQRALAMIKDAGAVAALALNPATPIDCVREVLCDIGVLLLMTVNPGYAGQKLVPQSLEKIARARAFLDGLGYGHIAIEVDGNCSFENVPRMAEAGAEYFVLGSSSLFCEGASIADNQLRLDRSLSERFKA